MSRMRYSVTIASFLVCVLITAAGLSFAQTAPSTAPPAAKTPAQPAGNQVAKGPTPKASTSPVKPASTTLVDLNTASKQTLMSLPGINEANAQKIIENRPYRSKADLTQKKVISEDAYAKIAARVVAKTTSRVSPGNVEKRAASSKGTTEVQKKYQ